MNINKTIESYTGKLNKPVTKEEYINERAEIVGKVLERLREARKGTEWEFKLLTKRTIAILLNKKFGGNNYALRIFLGSCLEKGEKEFGKLFWWGIKK